MKKKITAKNVDEGVLCDECDGHARVRIYEAFTAAQITSDGDTDWDKLSYITGDGDDIANLCVNCATEMYGFSRSIETE